MADKLNYIIEGTQVNAESITVPSDSPYKVSTVHDHIKKDEVSMVEIWENNDKSGTQLTEEAYTGTVSGTGKFQVDYEGDEETAGIKRCSTVLFHSAQAETSWYIWYKSTGDEAEAGDINNKADKDSDAVENNLAKFDSSGNPVDSGIASNTVPIATTQSLTFYVNSATGSDGNDGSSGSPFATIAKAISLIPQIVNHNVYINVADGNYDEGITLEGYVGDSGITITGNTTTPGNVALTGRITITNCCCLVTVQGFDTSITSSHGAYVQRSVGVYLNSIVADDETGTYSGIAAEQSIIRIEKCTLSNKVNGIYAILASTVYSATNGGTGNTNGLNAYTASTIGKYSTQPAGTTAESTDRGGVIR